MHITIFSPSWFHIRFEMLFIVYDVYMIEWLRILQNAANEQRKQNARK